MTNIVLPDSKRNGIKPGTVQLVGRPAQHTVVLPRGLVRRVIGELVLEEHRLSALTVPDDVVLLEVFNEQTSRGHAAAVHHDAVLRRVHWPADSSAMVGPPRPNVIKNPPKCPPLSFFWPTCLPLSEREVSE
jgi:hypothetical protein